MKKINHNITRNESNIRIILSVLLIVIGSHFNELLSVIGIILLLTGILRKCPIYSFLKKQDKEIKDEYYLSLLPKNNPEPVFIFDRLGNILFANKSASKKLSSITRLSQITGEEKHQQVCQCLFLKASEHINFEYQENNHHYLINLVGDQGLSMIFAYGFDITEVVNTRQEIINTQKEIVYTMGEIGERRSNETGKHVQRVAEYSKLLAVLYGLDDEQAELIKMASPMHDIGKVAIPDAVLNKPGKLDEHEFEIMKTHAQLGKDMLQHSNRPILQAASVIAAEHHEKFNGNGYPNKLKGDKIHILGRITALADVFDALGSDRVYKKAWPDEQIFDLIKREKGEHFDPQLVDLFFQHIDEFLAIRDKYKEQ